MFEGLLKFIHSLQIILGQKKQIDEIESLMSFVSSRSSYMTQVSLYGYLKARAGTSYVSLIKDPIFTSSMKTARNHIFFACLTDLTLHVLKTIHTQKQENFQNIDPLALHFFTQTLAKAPQEVFESLKREEVILNFEKHLRNHNWKDTDNPHDFFSGSRSALLKWAPVVEEFKILDEEIVSNSIHFKWLRVCQEFEKLIDFEKIKLEAYSDPPDLIDKEFPKGS